MSEQATMKNIRAAVKAARAIPTEFENQVALPYGLVDRLLNHADALERENAELRARVAYLERHAECNDPLVVGDATSLSRSEAEENEDG